MDNFALTFAFGPLHKEFIWGCMQSMISFNIYTEMPVELIAVVMTL
jgi:hypothetical protein